LLTRRAVGTPVFPGPIRGRGIRNGVESVRQCVQKLLAHSLLGKATSASRAADFQPSPVALPVQSQAWGSSVVSFRLPVRERNVFYMTQGKPRAAQALAKMAGLLDHRFRWLASAAGQHCVLATGLLGVAQPPALSHEPETIEGAYHSDPNRLFATSIWPQAQ
jgi:hypothetical protein